MTDLAPDLQAAMAAPADPALTDYRGRKVVRVEAKVTNVGDGLSESLGVGPNELEQGQTVDLLVRCVVGPHTIRVLKGYDDDEPDAPLRLVMTLIGKTVTLVDADFADERIRQQRLRNQRAADDRKGTQRLPGSDEWGEEDETVESAVDAAVEEAEAPEPAEPSNVHELPSNGSSADTKPARRPRRSGTAKAKEKATTSGEG